MKFVASECSNQLGCCKIQNTCIHSELEIIMVMRGVKAKAKKVVIRSPIQVDEKYIGSEPLWDAEKVAMLETDPKRKQIEIIKTLGYYNYFFNVKDLIKYVAPWLTANTKLTPLEIKKFTNGDSGLFPMTACSLIMANGRGMPLTEENVTFIVKCVHDVLARKPVVVDINSVVEKTAAVRNEVAKKVEVTIQDRLETKTNEVIGEIEGVVDDVFHGKAGTSIYDMLTTAKVPQAQVGKIRVVFQKQYNEFMDAISGTDEQLREGYSRFVKNKGLQKTITEFYATLNADLDAYVQVKKTTKKSRVKKVASKDKIVSKIKYMATSNELKLASISPVDIIGAKELWVYDTKYRKLTKYVADPLLGPLTVKGTSVVGFDESASITKMLRKPAEQLGAFVKASKVALRTFMKDIRTTETKPTGRINEHILLLKVA